MPKYLLLAQYTEAGTKGLLRDGGSGRRSAVEEAVRMLGGALEAFYFGFGGNDVYAVVDLPDNVTGATASLFFNASGRAQVQTTVLLTPEEVDEAIRRTVPGSAHGQAPPHPVGPFPEAAAGLPAGAGPRRAQMRGWATGLVLVLGLALGWGFLYSTVPGVAAPVAERDRLPAAILGEAPPPKGRTVAYFPGHPRTQGYLALPAGNGSHGAVILIHEWNGLVDRVRQVADALASEGYLALAADLYSGRTGNSRQANLALVQETLADPDLIISNLDAAVSFLRERPDVSGKIAAVGWCYGGGVALSFALEGVAHQATAIFYGRLLSDPERLARLDHEIYGTFAGLDQGPSPQQVGGFVEALRQAGIPNDIHIYDGVGHGFWLWVDQDPVERAAPALDAWERLKAYLGRTIG